MKYSTAGLLDGMLNRLIGDQIRIERDPFDQRLYPEMLPGASVWVQFRDGVARIVMGGDE